MGVAHGLQFDWTDARVEQLRNLQDKGKSFAENQHQVLIVARTAARSAVGAKLSRLGLDGYAKTEWTPERDADLTKRHAAGDSYQTIADGMGITRNSASKRARKLSLPMRHIAEAMVHHHARRAAPRHSELSGLSALSRRPAAPLEPGPRPDCPPVSLAAAGADACRFPVAEWQGHDAPFYCGADRDAGHPSYCRYHRVMAAGSGAPGERRAVRDAWGAVA